MDENIEKLVMIIKERFNMDLSDCLKDIQDEHLLGNKLRLSAGDLIYLYFDIEKEFGIKIPQEHIFNGKFSSLTNIAQMIQCELDSNNTFTGLVKIS